MTFANLRDQIDQYFDLAEIRHLCFDIGIDYEHLRGEEKLSRIESLLLYCGQRQLQPNLLAALHQQRPKLTWPTDYAIPTHTPPIPMEFPPRAEHFVGREEEITQLLAELQSGQSVALVGPGGMGKTAVAWAALQRLQTNRELFTRFPDGVLFFSFYGRPQADLALEHIARSYGGDTRPTPQDAARRALARKTALVILDGAEDADDLAAVTAVCGQCAILITSRRHEAAGSTIEIRPLPANYAADLLQAWHPAAAADPAVPRICQIIGHLPLAVRLVGRYLAETHETPAEYLAWLETTPIEALSHGVHREESVSVLLARSLGQVSQPARDVLAVVGLLALRPFPITPIIAALNIPERMARTALGDLVRYGLLWRDGDYSVSHALVHTYAHHHLPLPVDALARLADYYAELGERESQRGPAGFAVLDAVRTHLLTVQARCLEIGAWKNTQALTEAINGYLALQGLYKERLMLLEAGLKAARATLNRNVEGAILNDLGNTYGALGQSHTAIDYHMQALAIAREVRDLHRERACLSSLGTTSYDLGKWETAVNYHKQALAIAREIGNRSGELSDLGNLGNTYRILGQAETAIHYHKQALSIAQEIGYRHGEGAGLTNLGILYSTLGQAETAMRYYEQALVVSQEIGDRRMESIASWALGAFYLAYEKEDHARAVSLMSIRVNYLREIGHPDADVAAAQVAQIVVPGTPRQDV